MAQIKSVDFSKRKHWDEDQRLAEKLAKQIGVERAFWRMERLRSTVSVIDRHTNVYDAAAALISDGRQRDGVYLPERVKAIADKLMSRSKRIDTQSMLVREVFKKLGDSALIAKRQRCRLVKAAGYDRAYFANRRRGMPANK